jgi:hypothetical protein
LDGVKEDIWEKYGDISKQEGFKDDFRKTPKQP